MFLVCSMYQRLHNTVFTVGSSKVFFSLIPTVEEYSILKMLLLSKRKIIDGLFKVFLFSVLLGFNYSLYIEDAIAQYNRGRTTMAESIRVADELEYPVFIICPQPGFKLSYFKEIRNLSGSNRIGIENFIWKQTYYREFMENVSSIPETFTDMSYILGKDFQIRVTLLTKRYVIIDTCVSQKQMKLSILLK